MSKDMEDVKVPNSLTERMATIARNWVYDRKNVGSTVQQFCTKNNISSSTFYEWRDNHSFQHYISELQGVVISDSELEAYSSVKAKIIEMATAKNAGIREIEMFNNHFSYVIEHEKQKAMKKLGLQPAGEQVDTRTLDERKMDLFKRYGRTPTPSTTPKGND